MMSWRSLYRWRIDLHASGDAVVIARRRRADRGFDSRNDRVHRGVDALLGDLSLEHHDRIEVSEGGGGRGVGQVVRRHVDGLHGGDRPLRVEVIRSCSAPISVERSADSPPRRHSAEEGGDLRAGLREPEDVVDEEQRRPCRLRRGIPRPSRGRRAPHGDGRPGARSSVRRPWRPCRARAPCCLRYRCTRPPAFPARGRCPRGFARRHRRTPSSHRSFSPRRAIISWMTTVLPTPAPPKSPILPPRTNGQSRSTTLMPVCRISVLGFRSTNGGGSR